MTSRNGFAEPSVFLQAPADLNRKYVDRLIAARLHRIAAVIEEESLKSGEAWVVVVEQESSSEGRVYLELGEASEEEAARGDAMLRRLSDEKALVLA